MTIAASTGALKGTPRVSTTNPIGGRWSVANNLLKEVYPFAIRDLINNKTVLLEYLQIREDLMTDGGEYFVVPLATTRENGHNAMSEDGNLPDPINAGVERATYDVKFFPGRIKLSGRSMSATASPRGAFLRNFDFKMTSLAQSMARDLNRQFYGDGSGRLCTISANAATTPTVNNPGGFSNPGPGTQYLEEGMRVGIVDVSAGPPWTLRSVRTITSIDRDANVVTFNAVDGGAQIGDHLVRVSDTALGTTDFASTAFMREPLGLAAIINDDNPFSQGLDGSVSVTQGLVGQLSRLTSSPLAEVPRWKSPVRDNGGVALPLEEDFLNQIMDDVDIASGESIQMFISTHGLRRALVGLQVGAKRFTSLVLESGYRSIAHSGIPFIPDRDCTKGRIYGVNFDALMIAVEEDWTFEDRDGAVLSRMQDQHSFQALLYRHHNLITDAPNKMGRIEDLQDDF